MASAPTPERLVIDFSAYGWKGACLLGRYAYKRAHSGLDTHLHAGTMEICFCEKGSQVYEVGGKTYTVKGGDIFITFPGEPHGTGTYPEEKGVLYWLQLKMTSLKGFPFLYGEDGKQLADALLSIPTRHFQGDFSMKKKLDTILSCYENGPHEGIHKLEIMNQLVSFLLQVIARGSGGIREKAEGKIEEAKEFIRQHIFEDLPIGRLARHLHFSESHFKSWFKKETGMPPVDYILRARISEAKKLLVQEPFDGILSVAVKLNFSSSQYFATVFKKYTGSSPAAFRKNAMGSTRAQ